MSVSDGKSAFGGTGRAGGIKNTDAVSCKLSSVLNDTPWQLTGKAALNTSIDAPQLRLRSRLENQQARQGMPAEFGGLDHQVLQVTAAYDKSAGSVLDLLSQILDL